MLEGEIFLQNLPSIVTAHALGTFYRPNFVSTSLKFLFCYQPSYPGGFPSIQSSTRQVLELSVSHCLSPVPYVMDTRF